mgnify:CR=1 FL=1
MPTSSPVLPCLSRCPHVTIEADLAAGALPRRLIAPTSYSNTQVHYNPLAPASLSASPNPALAPQILCWPKDVLVPAHNTPQMFRLRCLPNPPPPHSLPADLVCDGGADDSSHHQREQAVAQQAHRLVR